MGSVIRLMNIIEYDDNITTNNKKAKLHLLSRVCLSKNKDNIPKKSCNVPWKHNEEYIT
jgi:hypothetical protein